MAGAFLVSLDSLVNIAFPAMAASFLAPPEAMRWVIVCYVLTYAVMSFVGGALGDRLGHGGVLAAGVALGGLGYLLCGLAPTFAVLLVGRVVQGIGAGLVYGTAPGIVTLASAPGARGRAVGFFSAAVGLALAVGPIAAGALVGVLGWRIVFHLRVPLALALLVWAIVSLPPGQAIAGRRFVRAADIARAKVVWASLLAFVANAGIFAIWLLAPFYLLGTRGLTSTVGGALFMLTPLAMTAAAPLAGWVVDRIGSRSLVAGGLMLEAAGLWLLSRADAVTPTPTLATALFAAGFGLGIFQVPSIATVMGAFGAGQQGAAGGLAFLARTLGIVAGVLALAQLFAARRASVGLDSAFGESLMAAAVAVAAAGVLALVPERTAAPR